MRRWPYPTLTGFVAAVAGAVAVLASGGPGDYQRAWFGPVTDNAAPAVNALAAGDVNGYLALHPYMGSFSLLLRAPFVAVANELGAGPLAVYQLGSAVCMLGVVAVAVLLGRRLRQPLLAALVVVALFVLNPMTVDAILLGHPEEPLAAALCVAAAFAVTSRRLWLGGVLLGLAVATKQWAIVAVLPVALAAPERRWRVAAVAAAVAVAITLPLIVGNPGRLSAIAHEASVTLRARAQSPWAPFAIGHNATYYAGGDQFQVTTTYLIPRELGRLPRPLIIFGAALITLLYRRRRRIDLEAALALLALCFLLRGALDPISPGYYYVPFLMALAAWEGLRRRGLPVVTLLSSAALWCLFELPNDVKALSQDRPLLTGLYMAWALAAASAVVYGGWTTRLRLPVRAADGVE